MSKNIMIVDDKETIAKIVSLYLGESNNTIWFENPVKGIAWLQDGNRPDLIITDIRMPEMRGDEFLFYLKSNDLYKAIPIIVLSAEDSTSERIRLLEAGAYDYIVKPFNPVELKVRVEKALLSAVV